MRYSILTNHHPVSTLRLPPHRDDLISCPLRDPVVIAAEVEDQFRQRLFRGRRHAPDIVAPFVGGNFLHLVGGHVSVESMSVLIVPFFHVDIMQEHGYRLEPSSEQHRHDRTCM